MTFTVILGIYTLVLGVMFYVIGRRLGLIALGMAAAIVLADQVYIPLSRVISGFGVTAGPFSLVSVAYFAIVLLVTLSLVGRSIAVKNTMSRIVHATLITLLFVTLTYSTFRGAIVLDTASEPVDEVVRNWRTVIIAGCLVLAMFDVWLFHGSHAAVHKDKSHK